MTPFQLHVRDWKDCTRCHLHKTRFQTVLVRGKLPADIVFIGEAPGESEDIIGKPFVGPAGKLLDYIMAEAIGDRYRYAITNLLACIPKDERGKLDEPHPDCVTACAPRVVSVVSMAAPSLIVTIGVNAREYLDQTWKGSVKIGHTPQIDITHPAAMLRANMAQQSMMIERAIVTLRDGAEQYCT